MGSPAELTLGCRPSNVIKSMPFSGDQLERMRRLEEYLKVLEDERKKIEAFKRELPFCMQLLSDAIAASKEQLAECQQPLQRPQLHVSRDFDDDSSLQSTKGRPVFEEFIPLKNITNDSTIEDDVDEHENRTCEYSSGRKSNGMVAAKFWSQPEANAHGREMVSSVVEKSNKKMESFRLGQEQACNAISKPILHSQRRVGGAFLPFSRDRQSVVQPSPRSASADLPDLALPCGDGEVSPSVRCGDSGAMFNSGRVGSLETANQHTKETPNGAVSNSSGHGQACSQAQRKARRCWSPELHRRFLNALQQLGGSQVATPKQIRELMKVDGLTNDEVKSHLQKYRLHTRRPNHHAFQTAAPHAPQLVVLGGIWVPPEYAAHAASAAQQAPPLYNPAQQSHLHQHSCPQDQYAQLNSATQLQLHPSLYYDQQHAAAAHSQSSSQGPVRLTRHSSVSGREDSEGEDGNEGSSWKGEYQDGRFHEAEENGDSYEGNLHANKWRYGRHSGEDDTDAEGSRDCDTSV